MSILIKGMEMPKHAGVNEDKDQVHSDSTSRQLG